jgi:NAD(P)-dependent dehydrogenase (short-subunit alcohol dehydrogenase family)
MDVRLNRRTAVVTAASRGIGLTVTRGLAAEGVHVTAGTLKSSDELDKPLSHATGANSQDVQSRAAHQMVTGRFSRPEEVADLGSHPGQRPHRERRRRGHHHRRRPSPI